MRWTLSAFLSTQKSAQKSKNTQKSALESKPTLLSAQKSAQTSGFAQKRAQMSSFTQKRAQMSGPLKKVLKRGDTQKSKTLSVPLKRGLKKVLKKGILLKRVSTTIVKSLCKIESNVTKHPLGLTVLRNEWKYTFW